MVVKILSGGGGFGGIDYNEEKVKKGDAHIMAMQNIDGLAGEGNHSADELKQFFEEYSSRNPNISKPQFHVAFSVKGNEMTHEEIADIAKKWMAEMGYDESGQPMIIYAHHDTGNNHIHIITSRVAPDGHKVDHNHERRRGRQVMNKLMGERNKLQLDKNTEQILNTYQFSSVKQFMAIFQTSGYEAYTLDTDVVLKRDGVVCEKISIADVEKHCVPQSEDVKKLNRRKAWGAGQRLMKIASNASTRYELTANARKRFGLGIIWLGKPDAPYGYMVVDHKNKMVYNGRDVWKLKDLQNSFTPESDRLEKATDIIDKAIVDSPGVNTRELNYMIAKETGGKISKGILTIGSTNSELRAEVKEILKVNDRIAWVNSFKPSTEVERDVLCRATGVDGKEMVRIAISTEQKEVDEQELSRFREAYSKYMVDGDLTGSSKMGMKLAWEAGNCYGLDFKNGTILNLSSLGIAQYDDLRVKAKTMVSELTGSNPEITTRELNRTLLRQTGCKISKGILKVGEEEIPLSPGLKQTLKTNDRIAWANSFKPTTDAERDILCRSLGIDEVHKSRINISSEIKEYDEEEISRFQSAYRINMTARYDSTESFEGIRIVWNDGICYGLDYEKGIMANLSSLDIQRKYDLRTRTELIIMEIINENPEITTRELNRTLLRQTGCKISKGILKVGDEEIPLSPGLKQTLKTNDRIAWVNSFEPKNEFEKELLHRISGVGREKIRINENGKMPSADTISFIGDVYRTFPRESLQKGMNRMGFKVEWQGDRWYCIDYKTSSVIDLKAHGFDTSMFVQKRVQNNHHGVNTNISSAYNRLKNAGQGGMGQKRDWEVGRAREYGDDAEQQRNGISR